ncbi:MAG: endonuclease/exonuclease/phosphatase family protein [Bryobacteraceae bacterium]|nr:endonuclease/exonuclease/phosphatase family protein [Bryobacteraceae bacterium]
MAACLALAAFPAGAEDFRDRIWRGGSAAEAQEERNDFRLVSWNIERGQQLEGVAAALGRETADILLLQEVDRNARRSGSVDIAEDLARRFKMNYVFAAEFLELGQKTSASPAYQGQAVLASLPIRSASIVRFTHQSDYWRPRWFIPNWAVFQRRVGGRLALAAEIQAGRRAIVVYNVHLESRGPEAVRLRQMQEVLAHALKHSGAMPIVIAGDLNVASASSPVIQAILEAGFRTAVGGQATTARGAPLDWIFVRGDLGFSDGSVKSEVRASDHYPVTVRISVGR